MTLSYTDTSQASARMSDCAEFNLYRAFQLRTKPNNRMEDGHDSQRSNTLAKFLQIRKSKQKVEERWKNMKQGDKESQKEAIEKISRRDR